MSVDFDIPTRISMFIRLQENQEQAWQEFVQQYGPMIAAWCLRHSLDESEAADVTQNVLVKLVQVMRKSKYDPKKGNFRSWLKTVTNNAVRDLMRTWNRPGRGSGDATAQQWLLSLEDPQALEDLNECVDAEYRQVLLREAERRVRSRVKEFTWRAFEMTAIEQRSSREVAKLLNLRIGEVYVAKSRVTKMLKEEVRRQETEGAAH
jgi:RNA polymerase sigma-70 factor (ECF subfamily)